MLLHEIVGKKGIASDVVVDTQTQQYPIYVFKGKEIQTYTDIDNELFGLVDLAYAISAVLTLVLIKYFHRIKIFEVKNGWKSYKESFTTAFRTFLRINIILWSSVIIVVAILEASEVDPVVKTVFFRNKVCPHAANFILSDPKYA